jgi:hypothetical protein
MIVDVLSMFDKILMFEGAFEIVMFDFVEPIHVELSDKAIHFIVSKVTREHNLFKFNHIFDNELGPVWCPIYDLLIFLNLNIISFTSKI